jgi:hypothetical protein
MVRAERRQLFARKAQCAVEAGHLAWARGRALRDQLLLGLFGLSDTGGRGRAFGLEIDVVPNFGTTLS